MWYGLLSNLQPNLSKCQVKWGQIAVPSTDGMVPNNQPVIEYVIFEVRDWALNTGKEHIVSPCIVFILGSLATLSINLLIKTKLAV